MEKSTRKRCIICYWNKTISRKSYGKMLLE
nr:MAG TPA: hypothetical protein [Caudoviricetes sp.]